MRPEADTHEAYGVPAVDRAIRLLRHVGEGKSVTNQSEAARALGINRTTLMRLIASLEAGRLLERAADGEYILGTGFIELAAHRIFSTDLAGAAGPVLNRLAADLGLSCHLGILDGRNVLYVLRQTPNVALVSNIRIGSKLPAHATTMGRIILSGRPVGEIEALYDGVTLSAATGKTATTLPALLSQISTDRARGYAESESAFEAGIDSIAAPVFDGSGLVVAAINVTGPDTAFRAGGPERRIAIRAAVIAAAHDISRRLGFRGEDHHRRAS